MWEKSSEDCQTWIIKIVIAKIVAIIMASLRPSVQTQKIISTIEILILVCIVLLVKGFLLFSPPLFKNVLFDLWLLNPASLPHNLPYTIKPIFQQQNLIPSMSGPFCFSYIITQWNCIYLQQRDVLTHHTGILIMNQLGVFQ